MQRISSAGVLGLIWLIASTAGFSQSTPAQTRDRRLEDALTDIRLLKRLVKEQDRRIADLEKTLRTLQRGAGVNPEGPGGEARLKVIPKAPAARWQNPLAWKQIQEGMSRAQVEELLGKPASVDAVIDYQTLTYKGDVPGGGVLSGSVKLTDDRVSAVSPPDF